MSVGHSPAGFSPQMCPRIDALQVDQIHNIGVRCVSVRTWLLGLDP